MSLFIIRLSALLLTWFNLTLWLSAQINPYFGHIGKDQGLMQTIVLSITQDDLGRMWFGTDEGLGIFDGRKLTNIRPSLTSTADSFDNFRGSEIYNLKNDGEGHIYFTANNFLVSYDLRKDRFKQYQDWEISAVVMQKGILYFRAKNSNTLYRWDKRREKGVPIAYYSIPSIRTFCFDEDDNLWLGTVSGLYKQPKNSRKLKCVIPHIPVEAMLHGTDSTVWIGTRNKGLYGFRKGTLLHQFDEHTSLSSGFRNGIIRDFTEGQGGVLWIASDQGLMRFNQSERKFTIFASDYKQGALSSSLINTLFTDDRQRLWIGSDFGGIHYLEQSERSINYYSYNPNRKDCLSKPVVVDLREDRKGVIWLSLEGGGLNKLNPSDGTIEHLTNRLSGLPLPTSYTKGLAYDAQNDLMYIATYDGIYRYDGKVKQFERLDLRFSDGSPIAERLFNSIALRNDRLYFGGKKEIYVLDLKTQECCVVAKIPLTQSLSFDNRGNLCTFYSNIMYRINLSACPPTIQQDSYPMTVYDSYITCLQQESDTTFLVGTFGNSLKRFHTRTREFSPIQITPAGVVGDFCYKILNNAREGWFVLSNRGLAIIHSDGKASLQSDFHVGSSQFQLTRLSPLFVSSDKTVYLGGSNGLVSMHPIVPLKQRKTLLYLSDLFVNNTKVRAQDSTRILSVALPFTKGIRLKSHQNNIRLGVSLQSGSDTWSGWSYEYRLKGFRNQWTSTNSEEIIYTNLPAGKYILQLKPQTDAMLDTDVMIELAIDVAPVWYLSFWAFLLWIGLIGGILYLVIRYARMRIEIKQKLRLERQKQEQLQAINEEKLSFFTNISHEFRMPLTLISSHLDFVLQSPQMPPQIYNRLLKTADQTLYLNRLINELIDFRKYDQKAMILHVQSTSIKDFLTPLYQSFGDIASSRNIAYSFTAEDDLPELYIDKGQMQKVIFNLLSNAFKFTETGGSVLLSVKREHGDRVAIRVTNTGTPIPIEHQKHLFDRFYQIDYLGGKRENCEGSGIGLALARMITEWHKGTISVESRDCGENIFTVTLRLGDAHLRNSDHVCVEQSETYAPDTLYLDHPSTSVDVSGELLCSDDDRQFTVLIVEDHLEIQAALVELLTPFYNIHTANDGEEGIITCLECKPDLIISDVMMPKKSGYELCSTLKNDIRTSHIPIILLTALNLVEHNIEGLRNGADDYIAKPFNSKLLLARAGNLIRSRQLLRNRYAKRPVETLPLLATTTVDKEFIERAIAVVVRFAESPDFDASRFASELAMSRSALFGKFKALTGVTPNDFIRSQRLRLAAERIRSERTVPIAEVATQYTFCTITYFNRLFKQQYGVSPLEYRDSQ